MEVTLQYVSGPFPARRKFILRRASNSFASRSLPAGSLRKAATPNRRTILGLASAVMLLTLTAFSQSITLGAPLNGATLSSPVQVIVKASGGNSPVGAIWIYVDDRPVYKTSASSVNTSINLSPGSHHIVPVAWNTAGQALTNSAHITVTSHAGLYVSAPSAGANVSSPVRFTASAAAESGRTINAMRIYVDSTNAFTVRAPSLNRTLNISAGRHSISMQAWDNTGAVYVKNFSVNVGASAQAQTPNVAMLRFHDNFNAVSEWMSHLSAPSGALLYVPTLIDPYFANIAAIGMTKDPNRMPQVTEWINWYVNHLNWPDRWGLYGTTYNWNVSSNGTETPTNDADSTDSYAATFLSVVWNAWQTGNPQARSLISGLSYQLDVIGGVIILTQQSDGLTWAKPDYQIKYLMDNCEAYRGLRDLASLYQYAFGDTAKAGYYNAAAASVQKGLLRMWLNGTWAVYRDDLGRNIGANMSTWYPDATAQVFPVLMGVVASSDYRASESYAAFNAAWPGWPVLSYNAQDAFPWCLVGDAAATMGDAVRLSTYINSIQNKYVNTGFPWPFYNAEAGWFIRANSFMVGNGL
jgi:hypothetical protein